MPPDPHEQIGVLVLSIRADPAARDLTAELTMIDGLDAERRTTEVRGDRERILSEVDRWIRAVVSTELRNTPGESRPGDAPVTDR